VQYDAGPTSRPGHIRTFHLRRGRMGQTRRDLLDRQAGRLVRTVPDGPGPALDPVALFGRQAPLVLEIGSGLGEATATLAAADPDRDFLAVEVHTPGIAHLLGLVQDAGIGNVRAVHGDALELLRHRIAPASLAAIHVWFPDPWPKARHHKRRIIQPAHTGLLASRLAPGGTLHCATDWPAYAAAMLDALDAEPLLVNTVQGFAPRPGSRPETRFERRALAADRPVADLIFRRLA
jgi:tRNA (guanine-N7-)-methyltransferase